MNLYFLVFCRDDDGFSILPSCDIDLSTSSNWNENDWLQSVGELKFECVDDSGLYTGSIIQVAEDYDTLLASLKLATFYRHQKKLNVSSILSILKRFKKASERNRPPKVSLMSIFHLLV